jgi:hypothetical protein
MSYLSQPPATPGAAFFATHFMLRRATEGNVWRQEVVSQEVVSIEA